MGNFRENQMTRKDFLKKSSAGVLSLGLFGGVRSILSSNNFQTQSFPEYRMLGATGIKVSVVGYGGSRTMEPALIKHALDLGVNFFDTGRHYFDGQNEVMLGKALKGMRKKVIIQTKIQLRLKEKGDQLKTTAISKKIKRIMQSSLTASLEALQTDYIDVVLLHRAKSVDFIIHESVLDFFKAAKKNGQIRAYGFSSHQNQIKLLKTANENKLYDVVMVPYNHKGSFVHSKYGRYAEWDQSALELELEKAEKNNTGIVAMKTCSGGPYAPDKNTEPTYKAALKWILEHRYISTMAVAMGNINEIDENVQAML